MTRLPITKRDLGSSTCLSSDLGEVYEDARLVAYNPRVVTGIDDPDLA